MVVVLECIIKILFFINKTTDFAFGCLEYYLFCVICMV